MRRTLHTFLLLLLVTVYAWAAPGELKEKLATLKGIGQIEQLESAQYTEKYLVRITQQVDAKNPAAGTFTQRVVVSHVGFDRPTVIVTEGYGGSYALNPRYQEELSRLFNTNVIFVEHRYFLESTPEPLNWDYLTAENSAYDLHNVTTTFKQLYTGQWISTGISKGGQTVMIYRTFFPDDVDISVPYVAPLCRSVEDGRHEPFLEKKVGTKAERKAIDAFQREVLKRRASLVPMLQAVCTEKGYTYSITIDEVLDYCVLEYPFAFWQWGTDVATIPALNASDKDLFDHLMKISSPDYFAEDQPNGSFFVQAARELGYYGYDIKPLKGLLVVKDTHDYLNRIMLPKSAGDIPFNPTLYNKISSFLKNNDPKMIFIYGEIDPWSAPRVPNAVLKGKKNMKLFMQPRGSHRTRIGNMPDDMKAQIMAQLNQWLSE